MENVEVQGMVAVATDVLRKIFRKPECRRRRNEGVGKFDSKSHIVLLIAGGLGTNTVFFFGKRRADFYDELAFMLIGSMRAHSAMVQHRLVQYYALKEIHRDIFM